jgi:hypothetical protein
LALKSRDPQSAPSLQAISEWATRPIDLRREMNDPAVAAVIFVEQPEGLCGLTNSSTFDARDFRVRCRPGRNILQ